MNYLFLPFVLTIFQLGAQIDIQPYVKKLDGTYIECDSIIVNKHGCATFNDGEKQGYLYEKLQSFAAQRYNRFQDTTYCDQGYRFELGKRIKHDSLVRFEYNRDFTKKRIEARCTQYSTRTRTLLLSHGPR